MCVASTWRVTDASVRARPWWPRACVRALSSSSDSTHAPQAYTDLVAAFAREFGDLVGDVISEVTVGCGPAGELRYPSYPEGDGRWRFPGVGEFQCYDKYLLADLKAAAERVGKPKWCASGVRLP